MSRVGLYARVSTNDQQTLPMQLRAMREYAARRGWTVAMQVKEVGSGATQRQMRERLIEAARRREIDVVLVWRLDRWGRSVTDLLATLQAGVPSDRSSSLGWRNLSILASASYR
ncbi:MAG: recombinase family protein [Terracidiphilus sp.]